MNDTTILLLAGIWALCILGIFGFVIYALYIRKKWLPEVEVLFRGHDFMSKYLYFSILACIQYGGAFTSHFLAKRSKMLKAREVVPADIQKHFILSFWIFMVSGILLFVTSYIFVEFYKP